MASLSNIDYWQRRYLQVKAKEIRDTEVYERALQPELNGLFRDLNSEMEGWYIRYANNNSISKEEAAKILNSVHTKHWQLTLKQFEEKAKAGGHTQELNNEYYRSRVARLQALEEQMKQHTARFAGNETGHMRNALAEQYDDTYMRTTFNTQIQTAKLTADFAKFNETQLKIAVSQPWGKDGKDFSKRIWKNYQEELPSYLMDAVMRGTFLGWSPQRITTQMHARFQDVKRNNIHRLVVSEMGHAASEATAKSYEENEIEEYEYMATLESHTCAICAKLDGEIFKVSDRKPGINYPLIHARCRCDTVPYIKDLPDVQQRWARDSETGKGKLIKNMKFDEWKKQVESGKPFPEVTSKPVPKLVANPGIKDEHPDYSEYTTGNLTDEDKEAVQAYYQGAAYDVNADLRRGMNISENPLAKDLSAVINKNQAKKEFTVHRKVTSREIQLRNSLYAENPEYAIPDFKPGDIYTEKGFSSTSKSNKLDRFNLDSDAFEGDTELVIKVPKGAKALDVQPMADKALTTGYSSEQEVILQAGSEFKVTKVELKKLPYSTYVKGVEVPAIKVVHMELRKKKN